MKRVINMFLGMIYPALISLFIFSFADAFMKKEALVTSYKPVVLVVAAILAIIFGGLFIAGFIWNIVYTVKHKDSE